jgi:hypothetical protein
VGDLILILEEIENMYPVDKIRVNNYSAWPILRNKYYAATTKKPHNESTATKFKNKLLFISNFFYGWQNWFKKYQFLVLSNQDQRHMIKGKYYSRIVDTVIDALGEDNTLYISAPDPTHYPRKKVYTKNAVSFTVIQLMIHLLSLFINKFTVENSSLINELKKRYKIHFNERETYSIFFSSLKIYKILFRIIKPQLIFIKCYYCEYMHPAIKAANELGIPTIEFQHGLISKEHPGYNINYVADASFFPTYLLSWGSKEQKLFIKSPVYNPKCVYPVGNYYIEYVLKNRNNIYDKDYIKKYDRYRYRVGVTLQKTVEYELLQFISKTAELDNSICYFIIPRKPFNIKEHQIKYPENVFFILDKTFYETMLYVDFHTTIYSSCAVEAPSFGVQNILVNFNNLSKLYLEEILDDQSITRYVNSPEEYIQTTMRFQRLSRKKIQERNQSVIALGYRENVYKTISTLLKIHKVVYHA